MIFNLEFLEFGFLYRPIPKKRKITERFLLVRSNRILRREFNRLVKINLKIYFFSNLEYSETKFFVIHSDLTGNS